VFCPQLSATFRGVAKSNAKVGVSAVLATAREEHSAQAE